MATLVSWRNYAVHLVTFSIIGVGAMLAVAPAHAQESRFRDVPATHWATGFVEALAIRGIVGGFPDGTFQPDAPVTRSQFAAMVQRAFDRESIRTATRFTDVPNGYWGYAAIQEAYTTGFMSGYPNGGFNPEQPITRAQVLVALANGLDYPLSNPVTTALQIYRDRQDIPDYARTGVAIATNQQLVVNFPLVQVLNPNRTATRAEVTAFLYQALVSVGDATALMSPYVVSLDGLSPDLSPDNISPDEARQTPEEQPTPIPAQSIRIPAGTTLPTRYQGAEKILLSPEEPAPISVTLHIDRDIIAADGRLLIPMNSQVVGKLQSTQAGFQFQTSELVLPDGTRLSMDATSLVLSNTWEVHRDANVREMLNDTAIGAAAAAGIAAVTGDRTVAMQEVLGEVAVGSLIADFTGRDRVTLININPDTDLDVTLVTPLTLP